MFKNQLNQTQTLIKVIQWDKKLQIIKLSKPLNHKLNHKLLLQLKETLKSPNLEIRLHNQNC